MARVLPCALVASSLSIASCNGDVAGGGTSETSTGDGAEDTSSSSNGGSSESSTGASSSDVTSSSESSSDSSSTSGETGEVEDPLELLILSMDIGVYLKVFHYRRDADGTSSGPTQIVPSNMAHWELPQLFSERRLVYFVQNLGGGNDLMLGTIDGDEMTQLDVAPVAGDDLTRATPVGDAEAIVFGDQDEGVFYRVDFPDGVPAAPVAIVDHAYVGYFEPLVDDTGRWLAFDRSPPAGLGHELAIASVELPDPLATTTLTVLAATEYVGHRTFTHDGESLFYVLADDATTSSQLQHVDLREDVPGAVAAVGDVLGPERDIRDLFPVGDGGIAYSVVDTTDSLHSALWFTQVADGVVSLPVELLADVEGSYWYAIASADQRWLSFRVALDGSERALLLDGGAEGPELYELTAAQPSYAMFTPDGDEVMLVHDEGDGPVLSRATIGDDGIGELELVGVARDGLLLDAVEGFGAAGERVLLDGGMGATPLQLVVDLSGPLPASAEVLNAPLAAGYWAQFGAVCSDGRHVGYIERNDVFGPERLMLADLETPGVATEVMNPIIGWTNVPQAR